jgi:hypothetical protein
MNVWLTRAALRIRGLSAGAFRVLMAHADACSPSGRTCLAGLDELARACELSPKHVMRLRAQLVDAGHLRKLAAAHPGQRPVYEVLPAVPIPLPTGPRISTKPSRNAEEALALYVEGMREEGRSLETGVVRRRLMLPGSRMPGYLTGNGV